MASNIELEDLAKDYGVHHFKILMNDEMLTETYPTEGYYIINLEDSSENGSHWVALLIRGDEKIYCDSFGVPCSQQVSKFLKKSKGKYLFNNKIIQNLKSVLCGFFAMGVIIHCQKNKDKSLAIASDEFLDKFADETIKNDKILFDYFQKLEKKIDESFGGDLKETINFIKGDVNSLVSSSQKMVDKYGDKPIIRASICRQPIQKIFKTILTTISPKFKKELEKRNFDELYHLFVILHYQDGKILRVEKNAVITITDKIDIDKNADFFEISKVGFTLNQLMENSLKAVGKRAFYSYSASNFNCQHFIYNLFKSSNINPSGFLEFVSQDVKGLFTKDLKRFSNFITNLGGLYETIKS